MDDVSNHFNTNESVDELCEGLGLDAETVWIEALATFQFNCEKVKREQPQLDPRQIVSTGVAAVFLAGLVNGAEIATKRTATNN